MRFFSMDACLAMLGIAAAVLEDDEEAEGGADGLDLQVDPNFVSPCLVLWSQSLQDLHNTGTSSFEAIAQVYRAAAELPYQLRCVCPG